MFKRDSQVVIQRPLQFSKDDVTLQAEHEAGPFVSKVVTNVPQYGGTSQG